MSGALPCLFFKHMHTAENGVDDPHLRSGGFTV